MDWADLPEELLNLVQSNLFPQDRSTFGLVCRSWNAVVTRSPWLMFYPRISRKWKFVQSNGVSYNREFSKLYQNLYYAEVCCCKYGWLLMSHRDYSLFFFDPSDSMIIEVPKLECTYSSVSFFHPPTSPHCFIFGIGNHQKSKSVTIGILKRGEDKWMRYSYDAPKFPFTLSSCNPVLHRGNLYCLDVNGNIGVLNINGQLAPRSWMAYTNCLTPPRLRGTIKQHFLFQIRGKKMIFAVFVEHDERKVNVFSLLEPKMKWKFVEDLGDKLLYLSHSAAFAETAPTKSMGNKIYFPIFHGDKSVYYSLDNRKYHSSQGDYGNINSYAFKELRFATWYTPLPTLKPKQMPSWK